MLLTLKRKNDGYISICLVFLLFFYTLRCLCSRTGTSIGTSNNELFLSFSEGETEALLFEETSYVVDFYRHHQLDIRVPSKSSFLHY